MPTSDDDLARAAAKTEKLRQQVADAEAELATKMREGENDIAAAAHEREQAELEAKLAALRDQKKAQTVRQQVQAQVEQVRSGGEQTPEPDGEPTPTPAQASKE